MSQYEAMKTVWLLMLIPFGIVLGVAAVFIYCAWRRAASLGRETFNTTFSTPFRAAVIEQPGRWLAVKTLKPSAVQAALQLHGPAPCSWEEGMARAREDKLFISPPISGWILVVGSGLPEPADDPDKSFLFLSALSRKLGQVQFFSASRALHHHGWALLDKGRVLRAYAWAGETLWNQGPLTAAEKELDMQCLEYASGQSLFAIRDALSANTDKVSQLAGRWSIDPAAIPPENSLRRGIVGAYSRSKPQQG
jgi:hypothetical protein